MAEGIEKPAEAAEQGTAAEDVTKEEPTATDGDVLEEDDDFEEFEHEEWADAARNGDEELEWEDNWDDEVAGEDDFTKRLRAELASAAGGK